MPFVSSFLKKESKLDDAKAEPSDHIEEIKSHEVIEREEDGGVSFSQKSDVLHKSAGVLLQSTAEGLSGIEELKSTMEQIAAAAEESAGAAEESLGAVTQIKQNSQNILQQSNETNKIIQKLETTISGAASRVEESSENMLKIAASAEDVSIVGTRLTQAGEEISTTVNLITKLAKRTSLLALNAAIEATRAKESGKSFSVMAKEIRALSGKSNEYAQEIKNVVETIQSDVKRVQETIVTTKESVEKSAQNATENADSMKNLVQKLINVVEQVNRSLEEFKQLDEEIIKMQLSAETIASAAEESAGAVSEVTQTISMQATAFNQSNAAAKMLEGLAKKIQNGNQSEDIVNELASAAEELSSAIEEIENSMEQSLIALGQIQEAAVTSKEDAQTSAKISEQSQKLATTVQKTVDDVRSEIASIQKQFTANATAVQTAGEDSKKQLKNNESILDEAKNIRRNIKHLKKTLRKIELTIVQTAALSINGSVEAMRVGELGEGFSVVSNDIRNLAETSEQNLDQITDIVDNLEDETDNIIEAIHTMQTLGIKEAESLIVTASQMTQSSKEIEQSVAVFNVIDTQVDEIAAALAQTQIASQQTVTAAELSENNANESKIAAEHISKTTQVMAENVSELIEVAASLKDN